MAILGGAKVTDKIGVIKNLLDKVDTLIIGGGMAYTFFKAKGYEIGKSLLDAESVDFAREMMERAAGKGVASCCRLTSWYGRLQGPDPEQSQ